MKGSNHKKIVCLIAVVSILLAFPYVQRYKAVNREISSAPTKTYHMGEEVEMEKDILINYTMEGYSVKVNQAEVLSYEEFLVKYHGEDVYTYVPDKVYDVEITLRNRNAAKDTGINLVEFYIQGLAVCAGIDTNLCEIANPELNGAIAIALRENSEMVFHLPFALYEENFRTDIWNDLEHFEMYFVATLYPTKKIIQIV